MKQVAVTKLKPGMIFSEPVYTEGNNLLVPANIAVRKKDLEKLHSWGLETVETDGELVDPSKITKEAKDAPPGGKSAVPAAGSSAVPGAAKEPGVMSLTEVQEHKGAYRAYTELITKLDRVFYDIALMAHVEIRTIDAISGTLIQSVREQRNSFVGYILGGEVHGHDLAKSSVNTAILSALIAAEIKQPNHKILQVVTGALLHDVGMLRLSKEIVGKKGGLSPEEIRTVQTHPLYAYKIVTKELFYPDDVGIIVLQHHERWNGEGYPRRVSGAAISIGARIVSVADAFEAMVSQKPYRNSMIGYQAMKNLLSDNSRRFDPDILKAFIQTMGIYPIGSIVLLNNGAMARVIEVRGTAPLRPKIQILIDESGKTFKHDEGAVVDLLAEKSLFISKAVDPKDAAKKNA